MKIEKNNDQNAQISLDLNEWKEKNEIDERLDIEKMKLEDRQDQAAERIRIAEEKLDIARKKGK